MYKDKEKQKESNRLAQARKREGITGQGITTEGMTGEKQQGMTLP